MEPRRKFTLAQKRRFVKEFDALLKGEKIRWLKEHRMNHKMISGWRANNSPVPKAVLKELGDSYLKPIVPAQESPSLREAVEALKVRRDALTDTIALLEAMLAT